MGAICDFFVETETFVLFLACITVKNRLPVPVPLERGFIGFHVFCEQIIWRKKRL